MAARLPNPGSDQGTWGQILNDYLRVAHAPDGTLKPIDQSQVLGLNATLSNKVTIQALNDGLAAKANAADLNAKANVQDVTEGLALKANATDLEAKYTKPQSGIPESDLATAVQAKLNASGTTNITDGSITKLKLDASIQASLEKADTALQTVTAPPVQSVAGKTGTVTLVKADVGLADVDNTSDTTKPISAATQAALDTKANIAHVHSIDEVNATGVRDETTFLRGDGTWATVNSGANTRQEIGSSRGDASQRIAVPAYFYPTWYQADQSVQPWARMQTTVPYTSFAVVNPASGPGATLNSDYARQIELAQASGIDLVGYVSTNYSNRSLALVTADVNSWYDLYPSIDGIFFDEVPTTTAQIQYYADLYDLVKTKNGKHGVVINPGTATAEEYTAVCDVMMNFEGNPASYRARSAAAWEKNYPASKFWHGIYEVPNVPTVDEMISISRDNRAGYIYFTDDSIGTNPWDSLPPPEIWDRQILAVSAGKAIQTALDSKPGISSSTKTDNYTLSIDDAGNIIDMDSATSVTLTIPPNSSVNFSVGTVIEVAQLGIGQVTLAPGAGVTLRTSLSLVTRRQYSTAKLRKLTDNEWLVTGDMQ